MNGTSSIVSLVSSAILLFLNELLTTAPTLPNDASQNATRTLFENMMLADSIAVPPIHNQRSPVIFVPGYGGNQVEAKLDWNTVTHNTCRRKTPDFFNIWLNSKMLVANDIDCFIDNMKLVYNSETRTTSNSEGVDIRIPGWGDPTVIEDVDPANNVFGDHFKDIGEMLVKDLKYVRPQSLRGAPYDFRKGPNENEVYFSNLKDLVENTYLINNNQPITLLAHSMGGPMALIFLQRQDQAWKDKYINSLITLASPWGGSAKNLKVFAMGEDYGTVLKNSSILKELLLTSPTLGWLLPSELFWNIDEVLVETQSKNYTLADMQQYLIDINVPNGWEFHKDNEKFQQNFAPPGVKLYCLHGIEVDTVEKLVYKKGQSMQEDPTLLYGQGDGTVNLRSLEGCVRWSGKQNKQIKHVTFPGVSHLKILKDQKVLKYIKNVLMGDD